MVRALKRPPHAVGDIARAYYIHSLLFVRLSALDTKLLRCKWLGVFLCVRNSISAAMSSIAIWLYLQFRFG